jgi:hypothetical protein
MKVLRFFVLIGFSLVLFACSEMPSQPSPPAGDDGTQDTSPSVQVPCELADDQITPGTPTIGTSEAVSQSAIRVKWARNSPLTETGFNVLLYQQNGMVQNVVLRFAPGGSTSVVVDWAEFLHCGESATFKVQAIVSTNGRVYTSTWSEASAPISTDACTPGTPRGLVAKALTRHAIMLTWNRGNPLTESWFIVTDQHGKQVALAPSGATSCVISKLKANAAYRFTLKAVVKTNGRRYTSPLSEWSNWEKTPRR